MTFPSPTELKKNELKKHYTLLVQQYNSAHNQLITSTNAADQPKLQFQIDDLYKRMEDVHKQLEQLERLHPDTTPQRQQHWEDALVEIDFRKAWSEFEEVYDNHVNLREGGAALLLAPDFRTMCADLFVRKLYKRLREKLPNNTVRHVPLGIIDVSQLMPDRFLRRLGSEFGVSIDGTDVCDAVKVRTVTDKMCDALKRGDMLFVEVKIYADFYQNESFLGWLLDVFWHSLRASLDEATRREERIYLKCLLVFAVYQKLPPSFPLKKRYCQLSKFDPRHPSLARVPLEKWSRDEVAVWLVHRSGLELPNLDDTVHKIYAASRNGEPRCVKEALQEFFRSYHGGA
jgi:hypothetical protein